VPPRAPSKRVLVVDDNVDSAQTLGLLLRARAMRSRRDGRGLKRRSAPGAA
jgi:hypoxanthine phosphoribosyltransferase